MTTTTAKQLRDHLSEYLDRLQQGEEIVIIRHSEIIGVLKPVQGLRAGNGFSVAAMFDRNRKFFEGNKGMVSDLLDAKEIYHQALDEQHK